MAAALEILHKKIAEKDEFIEVLTHRLEEQQSVIRRMQHQLEELLRSRYGRRSEKLDINQLLLDGMIIDADGQAVAPSPQPETESAPAPRRKSRHKGRCALPDHLPRHEIIVPVPEEEKVCAITGEPRPFLGYEETPKLEYIPETLRVNVYKREKYGSPMGAEEQGVVTAPLMPVLIERCMADAGMLAYVGVSKFDDHLPLFRLERILLRQGVTVSRKTMSGWLRRLADGVRCLDKRIEHHILACGIVHHDDTPVNMLDPGAGQTQRTRLWVSASGAGPPMVHFAFTTDRSQGMAIDFFDGYTGALMCDEYAGYPNVDCGVFLSCWAHARRYVEKAKDVEPAFAVQMLLEIARLYKIETRITDASDEERARIRTTESVEQLDRIFELFEQQTFRPQSPMQKAKQYILGHRESLKAYTTDPRYPIDNNVAERAIRRVAIGRKNWLFLGSETGGKTAATLMSLLGTCWANRINAWAYLNDVIQKLPITPAEQIDSLLPHVWIESNPDARLPKQT